MMSERTSSTFHDERDGVKYPDFIFCPFVYHDVHVMNSLKWSTFNDTFFLDLMGTHDVEEIPDWLFVEAVVPEGDNGLVIKIFRM